MTRRRRALVMVAVLAAVGLGGYAIYRFVLAPPDVPPGLIAVSGRIEGDEAAVAAKIAGRVRELTVREGDQVEAGQVVAVLDDEQIRAREEQAAAAVRQAEARVRLARYQITVTIKDGEMRLSYSGKRVDATQGFKGEARLKRD